MPLFVTVVGAGAIGGWTALHLIRSGARVTLLDAWGPGNSRSTSGDETRVIRGSYGPNAIYTEMVARSLPMWKENQSRWGVKLLRQVGSIWMAGAQDAYEQASVRNIRAAGMPVEELSAKDGRSRFPQMNWSGIDWAVYEPQGGFLMARRGCQAVQEAFIAEGGAYRQAAAHWTGSHLELHDQSRLEADAFVFACGPWLPKLLPEVLGHVLTPTRQELIYLGTPSGDASFHEDSFPAWVDNSGVRFYGIPGNEWRGFKVAKDVPGPATDPTSQDRLVSREAAAELRDYAAMRFPALASAPVAETRVCQYEMSADGHLIVDRLPGSANVWIAGGGSGHSYKFAPALGEHVAQLVLGNAAARPEFRLHRFASLEPNAIGERK
ncbi:MAG: FAD-dependent oxidoreductase [Bryobacteraceae bacterium]